MTNSTNTGMTLADFEQLLDVYGGDRSRWPTEKRAAAAQLVARDGNARRLLAEAEGLDRALERAPLPSLATEAALADRIVAAARRSPRIVSVSPRRSDVPQAAVAPARPEEGSWKAFPGGRASAAGLLAASLIGGFLLGLSSLPQDLADFDRGGYSLAHVDPFDEDVL